MTNGEKIQTILDIDKDCTEVYGKNGMMTFSVTQDWWNAEYEEPSYSEKPNKSEIPTGSTTKNGISNKSIIYKAKESKEIQEDLDKLSELNEPTTKNDLAVDCISRDEVCRYIAEFVNHEFSTREEEEMIDNIITGIERMPSVTPQPCEDVVSRAEVLKLMKDNWHTHNGDWAMQESMDDIRALPAVTPRPKGHWMPTYGNVKCSVCGSVKDSREVGKATHYCDFCGAEMEEDKK